MRKAAEAAVGARCLREIEIGERVRISRAGRNAEAAQQEFADEVRRLPVRRADAEVDARLAEMNRQELRMGIGVVQQADIAETLDAVVEGRARRQVERRAAVDGQSGRGRRRDGVEEFAAVHRAASPEPGRAIC